MGVKCVLLFCHTCSDLYSASNSFRFDLVSDNSFLSLLVSKSVISFVDGPGAYFKEEVLNDDCRISDARLMRV